MFKQKPFDEAEAASHRDIQDEFVSEKYWRYTPMISRPNMQPSLDLTRTVVEKLPAIFSWESRDIRLSLEEMRVASRNPFLTIMPCDLPYHPKRGDKVARLVDGVEFEVTKIERDGMSGILLELVQLGGV